MTDSNAFSDDLENFKLPEAHPGNGTTPTDTKADKKTLVMEFVPRSRPKTPDGLSKNKTKKWRKNWDFEEKKRKQKFMEEHGAQQPSKKSQKKKQKQKQKQSANNANNANNASAKNIRKSNGKEKQSPKSNKKKQKALPQYDNPRTSRNKKKQSLLERIPISNDNKSIIFTHLKQFENEYYIPAQTKKLLHPKVLRAGIDFADGNARGDNYRCRAILDAFLELTNEFECPSNKTFSREMSTLFNFSVQFFADCRPISVAMGNTVKRIKNVVHRMDTDLPNQEQKHIILEKLSEIKLKISAATNIIIDQTTKRISENDTILIYGKTEVIERTVVHAYQANVKFKLIIVDSRPAQDAKQLLFSLSESCPKLNIVYTLINCVSNVMPSVTKVILSASSIMSNGAIVARAGTATISLLAHSSRKPVIVCCETYKFSERVQIDAICANEIGDFDGLVRHGMSQRLYRKQSALRAIEKEDAKEDAFDGGLSLSGGGYLRHPSSFMSNQSSMASDSSDSETDTESVDSDFSDSIADTFLVENEQCTNRHSNQNQNQHQHQQHAVINDLRDSNPFPDKLLGNWRNIPKLKLLSLRYDLTPAPLVSMVITEMGNMPPTSAPVVIREYHKDRQLQ